MHRRFPDSYNIKCLAASDLKSTAEQIKAHPVPAVTSPSEIQEIFLNFHFSCKFTNPLDHDHIQIKHVYISKCLNFVSVYCIHSYCIITMLCILK